MGEVACSEIFELECLDQNDRFICELSISPKITLMKEYCR